MNAAAEANELIQFFNRFNCHDFSQGHGQIHVFNSASAEDDDLDRLHTSEDEAVSYTHLTLPTSDGV